MERMYLFTGGYTEPILMGSGETVPGRCPGIVSFLFEPETGKLTEVSTALGVRNPSSVCTDPTGPYLYSVSELKEYEGIPGSTVSSFRLSPETGELFLLNSQFTAGADACFVTLSPDGRFLLAANYSGGSIAVFPILPDHSLASASCILRHAGCGPVRERQEGPHPHQILFAPERSFLYVPDLGLDQLVCYRLEEKKGWLLEEPDRNIPGLPGQGIRHGVFDQAGKRLYVMTEMACEVNVYTFDGASGRTELIETLSAFGERERVPSLGAAIRLHPNGKWLYTSVRGSNHLAVFAVDEVSGRLKLLETVDCKGLIPRDFVLSPDGRYLLAANQDSDNLSIFAVDPERGRLHFLYSREEIRCVTSLSFWETKAFAAQGW